MSMFARRGAEQPKYDHDHAPEGCASCQPKSEKITTPSRSTSGELTAEEKKQVEELKKRDLAVRRHEQAHLAAAGAHARGGPSFTYQRGPDGKMYAVGGEVPIDLSPVADNPQATMQKATAIQRAALAPAEPSGPDRQIAAQAAAMAAKARQELARQSQEIISNEKKVTPKQSSSYTIGTSFPAPGSQIRQESSSTSAFDSYTYSQQKQKDSISSVGAFLSVLV